MLEAQSWVCPIRLKVGDRASYSPADDIIVVPLKEQFSDLEAFYSTLLHEMSYPNFYIIPTNRAIAWYIDRLSDKSLDNIFLFYYITGKMLVFLKLILM